MTNKQKTKIYSIQTSAHVSSLIEIETIILNGLYRFSILGVNQKKSSNIKDRVYSALRSQKVLNLKSDNKKITINLLPTNIEKNDNFYDLSIALGCLIETNQITLNEDALIVGELSILGNIIPSEYLLKSIYLAIENNIKILICGFKDLKILNNDKNHINDLIEKNGIKFISADTLGDLVKNIKNNTYYIFKKNDLLYIENKKYKHIQINDINIFKIILSISTGKNIFIENKKDCYIERFLKNLMYYTNKLNNEDILKISYNLNKNDDEILKIHTYPIVSFIDKQIQKNDIKTLLNESIFGFNVIKDFIDIPEDLLYTIKTNHKSSLLCFYNPCPCGNINNFFNKLNNDKCLCLQRNILLYKQKLNKLENNFFDFYIKQPVDNRVIDYTVDDYININSIINNFKNLNLNITEMENIEQVTDNLYKKGYHKKEAEYIISLSRDIIKLEYMLTGNKKTLSSDSIDLAIEFIKRDF